MVLYKGLVLPHIDYCDTIYSCTSNLNLQWFQLIQNIACRTIFLADRMEYIVNMHRQLKLNYLGIQRNIHMALVSQKYVFWRPE